MKVWTAGGVFLGGEQIYNSVPEDIRGAKSITAFLRGAKRYLTYKYN